MQSQIKIKLRPNNQITLTKGDWLKRKKNVHQSVIGEHDRVTLECDLESEKEKLYCYKVIEAYRKEHSKGIDRAKLDIIQKSQRKKSNPKTKLNKPKSFTKASGQKILESGAAMDHAAANQMRFCHEVTLTLPANTKEAFRALAAHTSYVINRLFQLVRRKYGDSVLWFFVWEYQKRGALHLHIALYHPDESEGMYICSQLIDKWHDILRDLSNMSETCMFSRKDGKSCTIKQNHQSHCQPLQKSVGAYFAKYAGKEQSKDSFYCKAYPVSRFWGSSKRIKDIIKSLSCEFVFDYFGKERECESKYQDIIENIVLKLNIVFTSSYLFDIQLKGSTRINRYANGTNVIVTDRTLSIAQGERFTFYFEREDYNRAKDLIEKECKYF